ncbi:MAG: DUF1599 domain-containing protein [Saprospiraceae bacterium]|nr:DUF1599 domain-containing protein [Saprospiraceae bacterium]
MNTDAQYDAVIASCRSLFEKKMHDYGTAWRILRLASVVDQIYIKAWRIRTLESEQTQFVEDSIPSEYVGILNYALMGLMQLQLGPAEDVDMDGEEVMTLYMQHAKDCKALMQRKNHDYGEAWRQMQPSSFTDLILMKILRMRSIDDRDGVTLVSEGLDANLQDIVNYAVFAQIKLAEEAREKEIA